MLEIGYCYYCSKRALNIYKQENNFRSYYILPINCIYTVIEIAINGVNDLIDLSEYIIIYNKQKFILPNVTNNLYDCVKIC